MMLGPHIFGGFPLAFRIIAMSSLASFRRCAFGSLLMKDAGLTFVGLVLFFATKKAAAVSHGGPLSLLSSKFLS